MALSDYARGYLITPTGVAIIIPDTLLIRHATVEPFKITVTRGGMGGRMTPMISAIWYRHGLTTQLREFGVWPIVLAAFLVHALVRFRLEKRTD
jgi:hypothetical protein